MKKFLRTLVILTLMCVPWVTQAQDTVTIGDGTSQYYHPFPGWYGWQYEVYLYTPSASEALNESSLISSIAFNVSSNNTSSGAQMTIWLKDVDADYALTASTTFSDFTTDATEVYSNTSFTSTSGWNFFELSEQFLHQAGNAILVIVRSVGCATNGGCSRQCYYTTAAGTHWNKRQDSSDPGTTATGTIDAQRVNIQLVTSEASGEISCYAVKNLRIDDALTTSESMTLNWKDNSNSSATYSVYMITPTDTIPVSDVVIDDTSAVISGLTPNTAYIFGVKADCDSYGESNIRTVSGRTACVATIVDAENPFTEGFEGNVFPPLCWTTEHTQGSAATLWQSGTTVHTGAGSAKLPDQQVGNKTNLVTPLLTLSENEDYQVTFWMYRVSSTKPNEGVKVWVNTTPDTVNGTPLIHIRRGFAMGEITEAAEGWYQYYANIPSTMTGDVYVIFEGISEYGNASFIDDIAVEKQWACFPLTKVHAIDSLATSSSITISWIDQDNEDATYTIINMADSTEWMSVVFEDTSAVISDLNANTFYTFGVVPVCSEGQGNIRYVSGRTACADAVTLPWSETFEGYASGNGNRPQCWEVLSEYVSGSTRYPYISTTAHNSSRGYYLYSSGTANSNVVVTPMIAAPANQLHVTFWASASSSGTLTFGILPDTADQSTFIPLMTMNGNSSTWKEYEFYTDTVSYTENARLAFIWVSRSSSGYSCNIDDLRVELASDCRRPMNPVVTSTTYEGATLTWEDISSADHIYVVRCAKNNNVNDSTIIDQDFENNIATLTGLESNKTYYAWVATVCDGDTTDWRACGSFTTKEDCYLVSSYSVSDITTTSVVLQWNYNTEEGREATGAYITVSDVTNTPADTLEGWDSTFVEGNYLFLTGLTEGHSYRVDFQTACGTYVSTSGYGNFQTAVCGEIKGNTTSTYAPFNGSYNYGYSQNLYTARELQVQGQINGIAFRTTSAPTSYPTRSIKVYMANTAKSSIDTNDYVAVEDLTLVYDSTINVSAAGWQNLMFDTPFTWDGTSNLVVAVLNNTGSWAGFNWGAHTAAAENTVYWYRDGTCTMSAENPAAPCNTTTLYRGKTNVMPDIRFFGDCTAPDCAAPSAVVSAVSENSVTLQWAAGASESSWVVEYYAYGDTVPEVTDPITDLEYTVEDLTPGTLYLFRVGSLCGDDTLFGTLRQGRTACGEIEMPFVESFEGWNTGDFPNCWYKTMPYNSYPNINSTHLDGTRSLYITGSGAAAMVASPLVPVEADNIKVTFWANSATPDNNALKAGVITDPADPVTFIECNAAPTGEVRGNWKEYEFYTDNVEYDDFVHVAFKWQLNGVSNGYIDSVAIATAGSCRKPNTPTVNHIGYYAATLHWNDLSHGEAQYEVRYSTVNDVDSNIYVSLDASNDSIRIEDLHNGTRYYAWIRTVCEGHSTEWVSFAPFTTMVSCYPVTNPTFVGSTLTTAAIEWGYDTIHGMAPLGAAVSLKDVATGDMLVEDVVVEGHSYIFTGLENAHNYIAYITTVCDPDSSAAVQVAFSTSAPSCGEVTGTANASNNTAPFNRFYKYGYSQILYPASALVNLDSITGISFASTTERSKVYTIDVYVGHTSLTALSTTSYVSFDSLTRVATNYHMTSHEGYNDIIFDSAFAYDGTSNLVVVVDNNTGSYDASGLYWKSHDASAAVISAQSDGTNFNPTSLSASDLSVKDYRPDTKFYGNCDMENFCSAPLVVVDGTTTNSIALRWSADNATEFTVEYRRNGDTTWTEAASNLTETAYAIESLSASTAYQVRVGGQCGENMAFCEPLTVYTECGAIATLPWHEDFESYTASQSAAFAPCWGKGTNYTSTYPYVNSESNNKFMYFYASSSSYYSYLITPEFDEEIDFSTLELTFDAHKYNSTSSVSHMVVGMTNSDEYTPATVIDTLRVFDFINTDWQTFEVNMSAYQGNKNRLIFVVKHPTSYSSNYVYLDNLDLHLAPACPAPTAIAVDAVTVNSITVNVTAAEGANVKIRWTAAGTTDTAEATNVALPYTIENLTSATTYTIIASVICEEDGSETRSLSATAATNMVPTALPYSTGFEAGQDAGWQFANNSTNGWFIGSAASNGGTNGMYISNDNGTTNAYSNGTTTTSYAYKLFAFETGEYSFSFDWKANGELGTTGTYWDFLRVFLAPGDAELTANAGVTSGTSIPTGWVDLADRLNNVTDWQHIDTVINIASAGNYQIVFCWRNDGSGGDQTPAAIDNISISLNGGVPPVGINEVEAADIVLYPNPATSNVTLRGVEAGSQVSVVDMNGRMVRDFKAANDNVRIDVSNLAKGAYFVRVVNGNTNAIRKLIVK